MVLWFLGGLIAGALLGMVLMGCMAANSYDELLTRYYELEHKLEKGNEDE